MIRNLLTTSSILVVSLAILLFVPPIRDWFFSNKMWPFPTPWDITPAQVEELHEISKPGDVIVERNLHSWQWILFCIVTTNSSWVHTGLVDENKKLLTMMVSVKELPFSSYLFKQSTEVVLLRPPYKSSDDVKAAIDYARSKVGTQFDPKFKDPAGNCNGLIATALVKGGIVVPQRRAFFIGQYHWPASEFFNIKGVRVLWSSRWKKSKAHPGSIAAR